MNEDIDQDDARLKCPQCGNEDDFSIAATVWVNVTGDDYLTIHDEGGDREYDSESACRCGRCHHQAWLGSFYKTEEA